MGSKLDQNGQVWSIIAPKLTFSCNSHITFYPTHFKLEPRRQEVNDDYNAIAVAKRQQRRHNDNRATRSVRVVSARCDQPTSLAYLVAQLDFQFMRNITWQKEGNRQWANGRQREKQVQPTSLLVAQLDVQFMRNMTWQKLQTTPLP